MSWRKRAIGVALGKEPADLVVTNGRLVNVCTHEVYPSNIAIVAGRVALLGDVTRALGPKTEVVDAHGSFLVPGLIDSHMHTESSGITLTQLARVLLPRGVTTVMYAHEIANVLGVAGLELVRKECRQIPLKVFFETPTSVPWARGLEMPAAPLTVNDVKEMLSWKEAVSLGESDYFDLVEMDEEILAKIEAAHMLGKPVNGHAAMVSGNVLAAVSAGGFNDDHENYSPDEVLDKLRLGMRVMLREANLPWIAKAVSDRKLDTRNVLLCIDDKLVNVLMREGGVDNTVRVAIQNGIDAIDAIQMATINPSQYFHMDLDLGSISPGKIADIIVTESLEKLEPEIVVANGQIVARQGKPLFQIPTFSYPAWAKHTVHLARHANAADFEIAAGIQEGKVKLRVMKITEGGWAKAWETCEFPVQDGKVAIGESGPYNLFAVVERHGGDGHIGVGVVHGLGLQKGAVGSSIAHDCHNLSIAGATPGDMALCVNALAESGGGFVAASAGQVLAQVKFEIAGLITEAPCEVVGTELDIFEKVIRAQLGFPQDMEFVVFNFISLQSSPFQAAITDRGLVDTYSRQVVPLIIS